MWTALNYKYCRSCRQGRKMSMLWHV